MNICERGISLRPMEIKFVGQTPIEWYHSLCIVALQNEPESITEIPKHILADREFVGLVASTPIWMRLSDYKNDEEDDETYSVPNHIIKFIQSVRDIRSFAVATKKRPLPLPDDVAGVRRKGLSHVFKFGGGTRRRTRKRRRR